MCEEDVLCPLEGRAVDGYSTAVWSVFVGGYSTAVWSVFVGGYSTAVWSVFVGGYSTAVWSVFVGGYSTAVWSVFVGGYSTAVWSVFVICMQYMAVLYIRMLPTPSLLSPPLSSLPYLVYPQT